MKNEDQVIKAKLQSWRFEPEAVGGSGFEREVWKRIGTREEARRNSWWNRVWRWIAIDLAQPRYATAVIIAAVAGSVTIAHLQAREANTEHWNELQSRYAQSIDPLAQMRGSSHR